MKEHWVVRKHGLQLFAHEDKFQANTWALMYGHISFWRGKRRFEYGVTITREPIADTNEQVKNDDTNNI